MWCKTCNIETNDNICPICGSKTVEDIPVEVYWCPECKVPVINTATQADKGLCPLCGHKTNYLSADLRPVFPEERLLLELLLGKKPYEYMSARGFHYLTLMGCTTIAQLVRLKREDFQKTANIGEKTIEIIEESTKKWLLENGYYGDGSVLQTIPNADAESSTNTIFGRILTSEMRTSLSFHNVSELNLSSRAANALIRGNYTTLDKIAELSIPKLTATKGIGLNTVNDIITQTRNWLTVNSYYESENFNISDNEKDLFEKLHSTFFCL